MTDNHRCKQRKTYGLDCPVAHALDAVGDRWTLLIIRDLLRGVSRYQDLQDSLAGISTNLLAERLDQLVEEGIVTKSLYSERPPRAEYHLTEKGRSLAAVVDALFVWGSAWRGWDLAPDLRFWRKWAIRQWGLTPADLRVFRPKRRAARRVEWI